MAITLTGYCGLKSVNRAMAGGGERVTLAICARTNGWRFSRWQNLLAFGSYASIRSYQPYGSRPSVTLQASERFVGDATTYETSKAGGAIGEAYQITLVYDKDDPNRQFLAVNGVKVATPVHAAALSSCAFIDVGDPVGIGNADGLGVTFQDAVVVDGHAASDEEVKALAGGSAGAADFVTSLASVPGVTASYYSLAGEAGTVPQAGDPGLLPTIGGGPGYGLVVARWGADHAADVAYAEPMVYDWRDEIVRAYVGSSGKTVTVAVASKAGGAPRFPSTSRLNAAPTIRIDGGAPITLGTAPQAGCFTGGTMDAVYLALPTGTYVSPGQTVSMDVPEGWFPDDFGVAQAQSGVVVANYAGKSVTDQLWPDPKTMRLGVNHESTQDYWAALCSVRNLAMLLGRNARDRWEDGTVKGNQTVLLLTTGASNKLDLPGIPGRAGRWVFRWDDYDPANPVSITPMSYSKYGWREIPGYANPGDDQGRGKVKVWELDLGRKWPFTLAAAVDATATTIPFLEKADWQLVSGNSCYLTIGDERILIGAYDVAAKAFTGCTRGWNGTTAAAHAAAASGIAQYPAKYGEVHVAFGSPNAANMRYSNLAIYPPGFYDIPETPTPLVVPPPDPMDVAPDLQAYFAKGVGALRYMTDTPLYPWPGDFEYPEQIAAPDQVHYGTPRITERYVIKGVKPIAWEDMPYFYSATSWLTTAETYPATLSAPITTAPAAGTVETVTIASDPAAPILLGQSLFAGDEVMRVVGLPVSGDDHQVERGSVGTTPATHPAGAIAVGYRIPTADPATYVAASSKRALHCYEVVFDEEQSAPISFGRNMNGVWSKVVPENRTAQRTFTLAAALDATSLDVFLTAADPEDWDVVARGLTLTVEGETLTVLSVDVGAGKVTVKSRPTGAAAHASGTAVTSSSSRILLQSADGAKRAYNALSSFNARLFPIGAKRAIIIVDDSESNSYLVQSASPPFDQDVDATSNTAQYPGFERPFAHMAKETNDSPGTWHWLNIPFRACDAAVYEIAKAVRDNLEPGRKVIFELSNELWNNVSLFTSTQTNAGIATTCGAADTRDPFVLRSKTAFDVAKRCFAEVGREGELELAICWQTTDDVLARCRDLGVEPDAIGCAPYFSGPKTGTVADDYVATFAAVDDDAVCDLLAFMYMHQTQSGSLRYIGDALRTARTKHLAATGARPKTYLYEGGLEAIIAAGTPNDPDPERRRTRDIIFNPNFYFTEAAHYAMVQRAMEADLFMVFVMSQVLSDYAPNSTFYWAMLWGPTMKPGRGDGRDGGVVNKSYAYAGLTDRVRGGGDAYRESVRFQAWQDYQAAWRGESVLDPDPTDPGGSDPEPDPGPGSGSNGPPIRAKPRPFVPLRGSRRGFR